MTAGFTPAGDVVRQHAIDGALLAIIQDAIRLREVTSITAAGGTPPTNEISIIVREVDGQSEVEIYRDDGTSFVIGSGGNVQKNFYEAMNTRFLQFADFTMPDVGFFPEEDGIQAVVAGAGAAVINSAAVDKTNHPGVWYFATGTTAAGRCFALSSNHSSFNLGGPGNTMRIGTWLKTGSFLSTPTEKYTVRAGLFQISLPNTVDHGIGFEYDDAQNGGRWQTITANPTEESNDTGVTFTVDTWYDLQIEINSDATSVEYFIDGVSVGTNTLNIPTGVAFEQFYNAHIMKLAGLSVRHILIDAYFVYMELNR